MRCMACMQCSCSRSGGKVVSEWRGGPISWTWDNSTFMIVSSSCMLHHPTPLLLSHIIPPAPCACSLPLLLSLLLQYSRELIYIHFQKLITNHIHSYITYNTTCLLFVYLKKIYEKKIISLDFLSY